MTLRFLDTTILTHLQGVDNAAMPDSCDIYHQDGWSTNEIGERVPAYPGSPDENDVPCRFRELSGEELVIAQAIDNRIVADLMLPLATVVNLDSQIVLLSKTWYVTHIYTQHGYSLDRAVALRSDNA